MKLKCRWLQTRFHDLKKKHTEQLKQDRFLCIFKNIAFFEIFEINQ